MTAEGRMAEFEPRTAVADNVATVLHQVSVTCPNHTGGAPWRSNRACRTR